LPIKIQFDKRLKKWVVINIQTHHIFGKHPNRERAQRQWDAMKENGVDMEGEQPSRPSAEDRANMGMGE
jgi:hypothetical protein